MIWRYKLATGGEGYGCPVTVHIAGLGFQRAVYQYPGDQVVDLPTGAVLADIGAECTGYPQQRAQQAVRSGVRDVSGLPIINIVPAVVG